MLCTSLYYKRNSVLAVVAMWRGVTAIKQQQICMTASSKYFDDFLSSTPIRRVLCNNTVFLACIYIRRVQYERGPSMLLPFQTYRLQIQKINVFIIAISGLITQHTISIILHSQGFLLRGVCSRDTSCLDDSDKIAYRITVCHHIIYNNFYRRNNGVSCMSWPQVHLSLMMLMFRRLHGG